MHLVFITKEEGLTASVMIFFADRNPLLTKILTIR